MRDDANWKCIEMQIHSWRTPCKIRREVNCISQSALSANFCIAGKFFWSKEAISTLHLKFRFCQTKTNIINFFSKNRRNWNIKKLTSKGMKALLSPDSDVPSWNCVDFFVTFFHAFILVFCLNFFLKFDRLCSVKNKESWSENRPIIYSLEFMDNKSVKRRETAAMKRCALLMNLWLESSSRLLTRNSSRSIL